MENGKCSECVFQMEAFGVCRQAFACTCEEGGHVFFVCIGVRSATLKNKECRCWLCSVCSASVRTWCPPSFFLRLGGFGTKSAVGIVCSYAWFIYLFFELWDLLTTCLIVMV